MATARNSRVLRTIPLVITIWLFSVPVFAKYGGGHGTAEAPYQIATAEDVIMLGDSPEDYGEHFILTADIDLDPNLPGRKGFDKAVIAPDNDGKGTSFGGTPFAGFFDGSGHTIFNLTIVGGGYSGLFGKLDSGSIISNLGLEAVDVNGMGDYVGGLVARNYGSIATSYSTGSVVTPVQRFGTSFSGYRYIGGLVGQNDRGATITNCYAAGSVSGTILSIGVGGLVGTNFGTITDCNATASVSGGSDNGGLVGTNGEWVGTNSGTITDSNATGSVSGHHNIGGLVGKNLSTITDSYAKGSVSASGSAVINFSEIDGFGGLVGKNRLTITDCYATGSVSGDDNVGGLVGTNSGTITGSSATGSVSASSTPGFGFSFTHGFGGLVGGNLRTITNCYATGSVSGSQGRPVGGLVGQNGWIEFYDRRTIITNCYATGSVSQIRPGFGGLVGNNYGAVYDCFWDIQTSGQNNMCGQQGPEASGCNNANGKTTAEMQDRNTFIAAGWDFVGELQNGPSEDWALPVGGGYPILWWQLPEAQLPPLPVFSGGTGEPNDPYIISRAPELNSIGHNPRLMQAHFRLVNDIDLTGVDFFMIASIREPYFGVFDGNGHTITNFRYTSTNTDYTGLFGYVGENAQIKDLGLINPIVVARTGTGGNVGCLTGGLREGSITNCYVEGGTVSGGTNVGGLVGASSGTITDSHASGSAWGDDNVGGLVGLNSSSIAGSYSTCAVSGAEDVGGLVGENVRIVTNGYATGSVTGTNRVGGLVGNNTLGRVITSYSSGTVLGTARVGGLIGMGGGAFVSYWDTQTSGLSTSSSGTGMTTVEMQTANTFAGWGADSVWTIDEGKDYPRLWWEGKLGETITTPSPLEAAAGSGTELDPYLIFTPEELNVIGQFPSAWSQHFKLMADIDLGNYTGETFNIIGRLGWPFSGVFDGNGKKISKFSYTSEFANAVGLFGYLGDNAHIRDLGLIDPIVDAGTGSAVGSLVGVLTGEATLSNCFAEGGSVTGNLYVGGLVGENWSTIIHCHSSSSVFGNTGVGGLAGIHSDTITNCHASGSVSGSDNVGGLAGSSKGTITDAYATASVSGVSNAGGLVGRHLGQGAIENCYAMGNILGDANVGGLVGRNIQQGIITQCYSRGSVTGTTSVGGLVGVGSATSVISSFWDTRSSGQTISAGGAGKDTAEMQIASTFLDVGWDFMVETENGTDDIWWILEGQDYPRLWWELLPKN